MAAPLCPSCGQPVTAGDGHQRCALDPPRFCPGCGRRLRVQVLPHGFEARCPVCDRAPGPPEEAPGRPL